MQDHRLTDECLPVKAMPCGDATCHAAPIEDLEKEERESLMGDTSADTQVMRVFVANLPPAQTLEVQKEVAKRDTVYKDPRRGGGGAAQQGGEDSHPEGAVVKAVSGPLGPHPGWAAHPSRHRRP